MNEVYLQIGGNIGNREDYLARAKNAITATSSGLICQASSLYETAAWGMEDQEDFINQVLYLTTTLSPVNLLTSLLGIEKSLGRKRAMRYGPRIIDIDILFYNDLVLDIPGLKIPHPQLQARRFVLVPLEEIAPDKIHPVFQKSVSILLKECKDQLEVNKIS